MAESIIDHLWRSFNNVRELHSQLPDPKSTILVWAWPGEYLDRPSDPFYVAPASSESDSLSLLPALSGLLRCVALELNRSIVLLCTDTEPELEDLQDATAFLSSGSIQIGDYTLVHHQLKSHEPRIVMEALSDDSSSRLEGHILSLGGARGIVAEMLTRLADESSHLSVVGRTALAPPDPELFELSTQDLMRVLMRSYREDSNRVSLTPRLLQEEVNRIQRQLALDNHLKALERRVRVFDYHTVDLESSREIDVLLDHESMRDIDVLISGAGVIQDQSCLTKTRDSFSAVLRTKVVPLCVLLSRGLPPTLKLWISFSSIASKSGNPGQADYAAANEFLNTVVHWFSRRFPEICMRTINWGPWQGSGMASTEVLQAFHSRGLEAVDPEAAAALISHIIHPASSSVEVSAVALQSEVNRRLRQQQLLMAGSVLWNYHCLPVVDALASDDWCLLFHQYIPYLQGHRKNNRAVVPAALMLCLAADLASQFYSLPHTTLKLNLYVFNGITIPGTSAIKVQACSTSTDGGATGCFLVKQVATARPHYEVNWTFEESTSSVTPWSFLPDPTSTSLVYCDVADVYSSCLFHSGVMARLCDRVVIDLESNCSWCHALPAPLSEQLGVDCFRELPLLPRRDLTLIDSLLQLLLVQTIESYGVSALPQELSIVMLKSMPVDGMVKLTITILKIEGSCLQAIGACCDDSGDLLFVMEPSKFTVSKDLLDFPPGISHP